jgi:molybdate transport system ATP-binding protein
MLHVAIEKQLPEFRLYIEFSVSDNVLVLFGPSGCGKTTILRCIAGLLHPDCGRITLNGRELYSDVAGIAVPPGERKIGMVFQDYALFPHMNVEKNILYGVPRVGKKSLTDLEPFVESMKISHLLQRYPRELSGGEQQRVALARALMAEPEGLLLDEPLSALDWDTRRQLQDEIIQIQKLRRIPFILVTHDRNEAEKVGNSVIYLEKGRCIRR